METLDCGDHSCDFTKDRSGMRTNGGCRCLKPLPDTQRHKIKMAFKAVEQERDKLLLQNDEYRKALEEIRHHEFAGDSMSVSGALADKALKGLTEKRLGEIECPHCEGGQICTDTVDCNKCGATGRLSGPCQCKRCADSRNCQMCLGSGEPEQGVFKIGEPCPVCGTKKA